MRVLFGLLLLLSLSSCTRLSYVFSDIAPQSFAPSAGPRFEDNDPHDWRLQAPWTYSVHGTDVSRYQGEVDWHRLRQGDISFAFIKATEGGDHLDEAFHRNWRQAARAGIPRGAYHFYYFCRPAIEQANWFIKHVPVDPAALPPVLDMEWNHHSPTCSARPEPAVVRREMQIFLNAVERHYGKRPIIYTTIDFFDRNGLSGFERYPFWLRSVASHPDDIYGNHPWMFWQYTGTGILPGIEGNADINVFRGSKEDWHQWMEGATS